MSEGQAHMELVEQMVEWLTGSFLRGDRGYVLLDSAGRSQNRKPPLVWGYVPDVYVTRNARYDCIIGEAKVRGDLENNHTEQQITAFLRKCSESTASLFVFAVPWDIVPAAISLLAYCQKRCGYVSVETKVLEKLKGQSS